jgi:tetratricopeptide (TPR) repeat protein
MRGIIRSLPLSIAAAVLAVAAASAAESTPPAAREAGDLRRSGIVRLEIGCEPQVREDFQTAVALLHSFFYEEARRRFEDIATRDPACAMAWWGVAMSWYHPLWAAPTPVEMANGSAAIERAKAIGGTSDLERGLIEAVDAYFAAAEPGGQPTESAPSCHGPRAPGARAEAFRARLDALRAAHPDNLEVAVFYSLALLATAPPSDKSYENQLLATAILEPLFEKHPDHPGIPHYIIHAYDYPPLAERGLRAARHYGDVAPWVPHALHMPSHIYTRLGLWADSIEANLASADAARRYTAANAGGAVWYDELHALDYVVFAYLQRAEDRKAEEVLAYLRGVTDFHQPNFAAAYALGAIPARLVLERRRWEEAADLPHLHADVVAGFPFAVAHVEFARAVGAARSGRLDIARQALAGLGELRDALAAPASAFWRDQVEIQRLAAAGWLARAEKRDAEAVELLRQAAQLEGRAGTHPVTPGQILPASEQLGDLLLELGRAEEALAAYGDSLDAFPNRFNGHDGAARAAERAGRAADARRHYEHLVTLAGAGDGRREVLARAQAYLARR